MCRWKDQKKKNNDIMSDIIVRLRTDEGFFEVVETLNSLDKEQLDGVLQMLQALQSSCEISVPNYYKKHKPTKE